MTDDFFRDRLGQIVDLYHPLAVLANRIPWQVIEASLAQRWARQGKAGKKINDLDLLGPIAAVAGGGVSNLGRPRLVTCLLVALLYLKHAFNENDEDVIQRWGETPKADRRMDRCHLKGSAGDAMHAVLCAAVYNIRWLLRMTASKCLGLLVCLFQATGLAALMAKLAEITGLNRLKNSDHRWALASNEFCMDDYIILLLGR